MLVGDTMFVGDFISVVSCLSSSSPVCRCGSGAASGEKKMGDMVESVSDAKSGEGGIAPLGPLGEWVALPSDPPPPPINWLNAICMVVTM